MRDAPDLPCQDSQGLRVKIIPSSDLLGKTVYHVDFNLSHCNAQYGIYDYRVLKEGQEIQEV